MVKIKPMSYTVVAAVPELLAEYIAECSIPELGRPEPNWQMYETMEQAGLLQVFGAYVEDDLVGFAAVLVMLSPHYGSKLASAESIFVRRKHRPQGAGVELMSAVEEYAQAAGCRALMYSAPAGSRLETLLDKRSNRTGSTYCKSLRQLTGDTGACLQS